MSLSLLSLNVDAQTFHKCDVNGKINYQYEPCPGDSGTAVEIHKDSEQKIAEREQRLAREREEKLQLILAQQKADAEEQARREAVLNSPEYQQQLQNNAILQQNNETIQQNNEAIQQGNAAALKRAKRDASVAEGEADDADRKLWWSNFQNRQRANQ